MTDGEKVRDLTPLPAALADDEQWLKRIAEINPSRFRVGIGPDRHDDELPPILTRDLSGWHAGRFIGSITVAGRTLTIEPRLGISIIEEWLDQAFGLVAPPQSGERHTSDAFLVRLLARIWCRSLDRAARHGLPLLRHDETHTGAFLRGRLDVVGTAKLMTTGREAVSSTTRSRHLNHPATRAIVCAERALSDRLSDGREWRSDRARELLGSLRTATGSRPRLPTVAELNRVRYTPITIGFKQAALLSHRIASGLGYGITTNSGEDDGMLIDVAELWELFVLNCLTQAAPTNTRVIHGTTDRDQRHLLCTADGERGLGRLKPDLMVLHNDQTLLVLDAKYKVLAGTRERPSGVDPADLYQLTSYATRFRPSVVAALAYPDFEGTAPAAPAERGPWYLDGLQFRFERLPILADECSNALRSILLPTNLISQAA